MGYKLFLITVICVATASLFSASLEVLFNIKNQQRKMFRVRLVEKDTGKEIFYDKTDIYPDDGIFWVGFGNILEIGKTYHLDYYMDVNKNGKYDGPPTDHAWRTELPAVTGDIDTTISPNTNFTDVKFPPNSSVVGLWRMPQAARVPNGEKGLLEVFDARGRSMEAEKPGAAATTKGGSGFTVIRERSLPTSP